MGSDCALHGDIARARRMPGLSLSETSYAAGSALRLHSHDDGYLCFVLQGTYTEVCPRSSEVCRRGNVVVHPADDRHANRFHSPVRCFNVVLDAGFAERMAGAAVTRRMVVRDGHTAVLAHRMYREFVDGDDVSPLIIEGALLEILGTAARAARAPATAPRWLERARDLLHARFADAMTLSHVAAAVGVHESHLARQFRRHYHRSIGEYVMGLRVRFACRTLEETDLPLSDVATAAGFCDQSHFTRRFTQAVGVSPGRYRRTRRKS
jgi:AraC family transcriptional regulator